MSSAVERILEEKIDTIHKTMEEVRVMKKATPSLKCTVQNNTGSILNGYREGDLTFKEAISALETISSKREDSSDARYDEIPQVIEKMAAVKTRADIWDLMYETEFDDESLELNDIMACMTDAQVFSWYPRIITNYLEGKK